MRLFNTILEDIRDKVKYYIKTFGCQMNVYDSQHSAKHGTHGCRRP